MPPSRPTDDSWRSSRIGMGNSKCFSLKSRPARRPRSRKRTATWSPLEDREAQPHLHLRTPPSWRLRVSGLTRLVPLIGGAPRPFLVKDDSDVSWSRDGSRVVYMTNTNGDPITVADRHGANPTRIYESEPGLHNHAPVWSTDGQWIYFIHGNPNADRRSIWRVRPTGKAAPEALTDRGVRHVARAARLAHGAVHGARSGGRRPVAVGARHGNANIAPGDPGPRAVHLDRGVRRWATARRVRRQTARRTS